MEQENYNNLKQFIMTDFKIKKELVDMRPPLDTDAISIHVLLKYSNYLYDSLRYIIRELKKMIAPYDKDSLFSKRIDELSKKWIMEFINCKLDINRFHNYYQYIVTDMSLDIVDGVKREFSGYKIFKSKKELLNKCKTINEMLHVMHTYIMNNEANLQSLNVLSSKQNDYGYPITLYGEESDIAKNLFNNFPCELNVGYTDIVSFGDIGKVMIMVRDRGHALSIELDYNDNDILVNYYIPKLCNIEMINKLPGVIKVDENSDIFDGTTGKFITTKDTLCDDLFKFIEMVPTDADMFRDINTSSLGR